MHTLHYITVEADSQQEAEEKVIAHFTNNYEEGAQWWDWCDDSIGGRWSATHETVQLNDTTNVSKVFDFVKEARRAEVKRLSEDISLDNFASYISNYDGSEFIERDMFELWKISRIVAILSGDWNCDSYYLDLETMATDLQDVKVRLETNPNNQYAVPIDFHF